MFPRIVPPETSITCSWLAALCAIGLGGACQSAPGTQAEAADAAPEATPVGSASAPPDSPWNQPVPSGVRKPSDSASYGFATNDAGSLIVFDSNSGAVLAEHPLGNSVFDLAWLPAACRLMVRVSSNGRAQRIFAYEPRWEAGELALALESASEEYWGDPQILGVRSYVSPTAASMRAQRRPETLWLSQGDPVAEWQRLGSELELLSPGVAWPEPISWAALPRGNVVAIVGKAAAREVAFATLDGSEQHLERYPLPRASVLATRGADLWVWQEAEAGELPRLSRFDALAPLGAPTSTLPYLGPARAVALAATAHGAVALLDEAGSFRLWSVEPDSSRSAHVDAPISDMYRPLALEARAAWVATDAGVSRFTLPRLDPQPSFDGTQLRGPLLVPERKALRCFVPSAAGKY